MEPSPAEAERLVRRYLAAASYTRAEVESIELVWYDGRWLARCIIPRRGHAVILEIKQPRTPYEYDEGAFWVVRQRSGQQTRKWPPEGSKAPKE